jgi:hypothetical protein
MITIAELLIRVKNNNYFLSKDEAFDLFFIIPDAFNVLDLKWGVRQWSKEGKIEQIEKDKIFIKGLNLEFEIRTKE